MTDPTLDVAYVVPFERFIYRVGGEWQVQTPITKAGVEDYLLARGLDRDTAKAFLSEKLYVRVVSVECLPKEPEMSVDEQGLIRLNTWVQPSLVPEPAPYPRIEALLSWLCDHEEDAVEWFCHWLAAKVQNPALVAKVAAVFGTIPGAGKGTLFRVIQEMMGPGNCAVLSRGTLESRFNSRWADKLFVLADEIVTRENSADIDEKLKFLVTSPTIEVEGKGTNAREVTNRLAWLFATNDQVMPLRLQPGDRRYAVFANHDPLTNQYRDMLRSCYDETGAEFLPDFVKELKGFYADLLSLEVDRPRIALPPDTKGREILLSASLDTHDMFFATLEEDGIDPLLEELKSTPDGFHLHRTREEWDFGEQGVSLTMLHAAYSLFARKSGRKPLALNKFGAVLKNRRPAVDHVRARSPSGRRPVVYRVPRKPVDSAPVDVSRSAA